MLVRDRMTSPVVTIEPRTPLYEALAMMKSRHIRRLPVMKGRRLVGIVTFTDLMRAQPSSANSLAVWEIPALLLKTYVSEIMSKEVVTISATASVEEAAVLMRDHKIGGLPVVEQGALLGIITESDIFDAFVDLMGLRRGGARLTIDLERTQALDDVVSTVRDCDVEIRSLAAYSVNGHREVVVRVDRPYPLHLVQTMTERGLRVTHLAALPEDQSKEERKSEQPGVVRMSRLAASEHVGLPASLRPLSVRWHGRGGFGAKTAATLFAEMIIDAGGYGQAAPEFGPERRGAPVQAFTRIAPVPITLRGPIEEPDVLVVLDPRLLRTPTVTSGLRVDTWVLVNTSRPVSVPVVPAARIITLDASAIARQTVGKDIPNIPMLAAVVALLDLVPRSWFLYWLRRRLAREFRGDVVDANLQAAEAAVTAVYRGR